ncbi:MAG: hypothetical protein HGA71_05470 [Azonexaceae bacterium]|nr:hypothetical protein [Azonexaceae bacterium]
MRDRPPVVLHWPGIADPAQDLIIVAIETPKTTIRDVARQRVRDVLRDILGDVELISSPGQPLRLAIRDNPPGISVSHEAGLSLLAIHRGGPVGVDLLRVPNAPNWQSQIAILADDYLGPYVAQQLSVAAQPEQIVQFAQAWTEHEARLKCLGVPLIEWSPHLKARLAPCRAQRLTLPDGYIGAVATLKSAGNRAF